MTNNSRSPQETKRVVLNGPRPSPLRVNKGSHVIQKPSFPAPEILHQQQKQEQNPRLNQPRKQPVIIYTHSPKVIHTQPKDFMALVQKLTGFKQSEGDGDGVEYPRDDGKKCGMEMSSAVADEEDNEVTSGGDDKSNETGCGNKHKSEAFSANQKGQINPYFTEFPLFTPNSSHLFSSLSPQPIFRCPDLMFTSPNVNLSPSFIEFIKGLPEY